MKTQETCGQLPILTLMSLARQNGWKTELLDARNRGDVTGEQNRRVDDAAVASCAPVPEIYGAVERKFLLDLARTTLARIVTNAPMPEIHSPEVPPQLTAPKACFVTLTEAGELRGCVGHILPQTALYQAVADNALNAALHDRRFPPVRADEVDKIEIEISVLTGLQPLFFSSPQELLDKLVPYADGVVLRIGSRSATFLPQVWDQLPDPVEFLDQLAKKAGCDAAAWRGKDASVATYHVESFQE